MFKPIATALILDEDLNANTCKSLLMGNRKFPRQESESTEVHGMNPWAIYASRISNLILDA